MGYLRHPDPFEMIRAMYLHLLSCGLCATTFGDAGSVYHPSVRSILHKLYTFKPVLLPREQGPGGLVAQYGVRQDYCRPNYGSPDPVHAVTRQT